MKLADVNLSQTRDNKISLMGYNSHSARIDGIDTTSISDIGGFGVACLGIADLREFNRTNNILEGSGFKICLRIENILAIETARTLLLNGDPGPYTTRPMFASVEGANILISHFLIPNIKSSGGAKRSRFATNKRASASKESLRFGRIVKREQIRTVPGVESQHVTNVLVAIKEYVVLLGQGTTVSMNITRPSIMSNMTRVREWQQ